MSASQRTKGHAFEREIADRFRQAGFEAERNLTQSRDGGWDLDTDVGPIECKKRARLPSYLCPGENVRAVVFAQDRGPRLVLLRLDDALTLLLQSRELARAKSDREPS